MVLLHKHFPLTQSCMMLMEALHHGTWICICIHGNASSKFHSCMLKLAYVVVVSAVCRYCPWAYLAAEWHCLASQAMPCNVIMVSCAVLSTSGHAVTEVSRGENQNGKVVNVSNESWITTYNESACDNWVTATTWLALPCANGIIESLAWLYV